MGFERLAAGVIVIGLLLWGASILATPKELRDPSDVEPAADLPRGPLGLATAPPGDEDRGDEDDEEEDDDRDGDEGRRGKGKKGRGGD